MEKRLNLIIPICFSISCPFLTLLLCNQYKKIEILITCILSFIIGLILTIKYIKDIKFEYKKLLLSLVIALYTDKILSQFYWKNIDFVQYILLKLFKISFSYHRICRFISVLAIPALTVLIYLFITKIVPKILNEIKNLKNIEKRFIIAMSIIGFIISTIIGCTTTVFFKPLYNGKVVPYDVIYTSDTGSISEFDAFTNVNHEENDIRQPLFGVAALPFGIICHAISELIFFIPNTYEVCISTMQFVLLSTIIVILSRILEIKDKNKLCFYLLILLSGPYLVFSYCIEQYVIALFYLMLSIYIWNIKKVKVNYSYIGAVGTMLTSGIIFPTITTDKKLKDWVKNIFKCFIGFLVVVIISGQLFKFTSTDRLKDLLNNFSGQVTFKEQIQQFTYFMESTLLLPKGQNITHDKIKHSYQLLNTKTFSAIGIIIAIIVTISFILNRKEKTAHLCFYWFTFSIIVLGIIGWGAFENGMFLYSLYFSWAYLGMIYLFINKIFKKEKNINIAMITLLVLTLIINIPELMNIFKFAIQYYK